jgi:hypothetical protein
MPEGGEAVSGTWIRIAARGAVEEVAAPDIPHPGSAIAPLLGCGLTMAICVTGTIAIVVDESCQERGHPVNTVAHLAAALFGPGAGEPVRGDAVLAAPHTGAGLAGAALERARSGVDLAVALRPAGTPPGQYRLPSALDASLAVTFGWDGHQDSFFVEVADADGCLLAAGSARRQIDTVARLEQQAAGHLVIGSMLARLLRLDRAVTQLGGQPLVPPRTG